MTDILTVKFLALDQDNICSLERVVALYIIKSMNAKQRPLNEQCTLYNISLMDFISNTFSCLFYVTVARIYYFRPHTGR